MLAGKNVLITGGAGGVGYAVAKAIYAQGGRVLLFDAMLDPSGEPEVAGEARLFDRARLISGDTRRVDYLYGNVVDESSIDAALELMEKRFGAIDGLITCHALAWEQSLLAQDHTMLQRVFEQDVVATFRCVQKVAARIVERDLDNRAGSIVLSVHAGALRGIRSQSAVSAASAALMSMTRSFALELRKHKIRVNAVAPTARTRLTENSATFQAVAPESLRAESVAPLYAFLMSDAASELSGEVLGAAGKRIYSLQTSETVGHFFESEAPMVSEYPPAVVAALRDS